MQAKVGPALHKLDQALKSVQSQPVIPVVGQVGHEDADLKIKKAWDTGKSGNRTVLPGLIPWSARSCSQFIAVLADKCPSARKQCLQDKNSGEERALSNPWEWCKGTITEPWM